MPVLPTPPLFPDQVELLKSDNVVSPNSFGTEDLGVRTKALEALAPLYHEPEALKRILSVQSTRKVTKNLEFSHNCNLYQIQRPGGGYHLRNATVIVCEGTDGVIEVFYKSESLRYKITPQFTKQPKPVDTKEINPFINHLVSIGAEAARYPQGPIALPSLSMELLGGCGFVDNAQSYNRTFLNCTKRTFLNCVDRKRL